MTFKQYLESRGLSKKTVEHYSMYLLDYLTWLDRQGMEAEQARSTDVTGYLGYLQKKGQASNTRNIRLNVIRQFYNYQIEHKHHDHNPTDHIKLRGAKRKILYPILSRQDLEGLFIKYKVPNDHVDLENETEIEKKKNRNWYEKYCLTRKRNKAILSIMIHQGLRTEEINRMELKDLKLREGKVYIRGGRRSEERWLDLKPSQVVELMEYEYKTREKIKAMISSKRFTDNGIKYLFLPVPSSGGKVNKEGSIMGIWSSLRDDLRRINGGFINFKQMRSSVITHWLKRYNLREVQYMAGHRYVSSTESYLASEMESMQEDIDRYHPLG